MLLTRRMSTIFYFLTLMVLSSIIYFHWNFVRQVRPSRLFELFRRGSPSFPGVVFDDNFCSREKVFLLTLVHTAAHHFEHREVIRETWASIKTHRGRQIRNVFIVGHTSNKNHTARLEEERLKHRDLVQGDFVDSYNNMTLKEVFWIRWLADNCKDVQYILKTDDDIVANTDTAVDYIMSLKGELKDKPYIGRAYRGPGPVRNPKDKWYVTVDQWPYNYYPTFHYGPGILMSLKTIKAFSDALVSEKVEKRFNTTWRKFSKCDDAYLGALAYVSNITATDDGDKFRLSPGCQYPKCKLLHTLTFLTVSPSSVKMWWERLAKERKNVSKTA